METVALYYYSALCSYNLTISKMTIISTFINLGVTIIKVGLNILALHVTFIFNKNPSIFSYVCDTAN